MLLPHKTFSEMGEKYSTNNFFSKVSLLLYLELTESQNHSLKLAKEKKKKPEVLSIASVIVPGSVSTLK